MSLRCSVGRGCKVVASRAKYQDHTSCFEYFLKDVKMVLGVKDWKLVSKSLKGIFVPGL